MSESTLLVSSVDYDNELTESGSERFTPRKKAISRLRSCNILLISLMLNVVISMISVTLLLSPSPKCSGDRTDTESDLNGFIPPGVDEEVMMPVRFGWEYYAERVDDMEEVDRNWAALNPHIGWVSLPREEFSQWGVVSSGKDPRDPSKELYGLQSYHLIHCLKVVRHTMMQLANGEKLDIRFGHSMHCLGALLRNIMCSVDVNSLPVDVPGNDYSDYQYVRRCRNWAALSRWTSERTSCLKITADGTLDENHPDLENCTKTDGVIFPTFARNRVG